MNPICTLYLMMKHLLLRTDGLSRSLRCAALVLLAGCGAAVPANTPVGSARLPNIVFILADDLGYGDLGVYGQETIRTPRLDQMAGEGIRFTDHYAGSPICAPSRSVLMTGQHTGRTWVRGNSSPEGERIPLRPEDVTVAEVLKRAGYVTGAIGKWGLGEPGTTGIPNAQGFDYWFGYLNQAHAHTYYPDYLWRNQERVTLQANRNGARRQHAHDLLTEEALGFIERHRDEPFFLYLPYTMPHAELAPPPNSLTPYVDENGNSIFEEMPFSGAGNYSAQPMPKAAYAAMVTRLDQDVGVILERLRELGLAENTLVIFSSDNGPHSSGGYNPSYFRSSGPLRGGKRDLYEGGIRVPMVAWWPGRVAPGTVTDHTSAFWDFLPTAAEIAGVKVPDGIDGLSYLPTLLGREQPRHEVLYWEFHGGAGAQAVRMGRWKAVRSPAFRGEIELYDLASDLAEERNVASLHPEIVASARAAMEREHTPSPFWGRQTRDAD